MSEANDTRPTVAAKAGDWVELRCGWVVGPVGENRGADDYPLFVEESLLAISWVGCGRYDIESARHQLDVVAIVPRPAEKTADRPLTSQPPDDEPTACGLHPSGYAIEKIIEHHSRNVAGAIAMLLHVHVDNWDDERNIEEAARLLGRELKRIEAARKAGE